MPLSTRYGFADAPTSAIIGDGSLAWTTSTGSLASSGTSLTVASSSAFPFALEFDIVIGVRNATTGVWATAETRHVTVVSGTTWTVSAGSLSHVSGSDIAHVLTATALTHNPGALTDTGDVPYLLATGRMGRLAAPADGAYSVTWASGVPSWTSAATTSTLLVGGADPDGWAFGSVLNVLAYSTTTGFLYPVVIATTWTPSVDVVGHAQYPVSLYYEVGGTHSVLGGTFVNATVEINGSVSMTGVQSALDGYVNWFGSGAGATIVGMRGACQTYDGTVTLAVGVNGWVGVYGGTVGTVMAFRAERPSHSGVITGDNIAFFNDNMTGLAGTGRDFAWYSEGGTNHLETGKADAVGLEIERFSAQSAALLRILDADGTTVLSTVVAANGLDMVMGGTVKATGYLSSDGTAGTTGGPWTSVMVKNGLVVSGS